MQSSRDRKIDGVTLLEVTKTKEENFKKFGVLYEVPNFDSNTIPNLLKDQCGGQVAPHVAHNYNRLWTNIEKAEKKVDGYQADGGVLRLICEFSLIDDNPAYILITGYKDSFKGDFYDISDQPMLVKIGQNANKPGPGVVQDASEEEVKFFIDQVKKKNEKFKPNVKNDTESEESDSDDEMAAHRRNDDGEKEKPQQKAAGIKNSPLALPHGYQKGISGNNFFKSMKELAAVAVGYSRDSLKEKLGNSETPKGPPKNK